MTSYEREKDSAEGYLDAFNDLAERFPELAREIFGRLLDGIKELDRRIGRDLVTLVGLAFVFELLNRNLLGEATAFGMKAANVGFVRYFIPVGIAFFLFRLFLTIRDRNFNVSIADAICARTYPELARSRLLRIVTPPGAVLSSSNPPDGLVARRSMAYRNAIDAVEIVTLCFVIPIGFTGYSVAQLFRQSDSPFIGPIIVAVATTVLLVAAYMVFVTSESEILLPEPRLARDRAGASPPRPVGTDVSL